MCGISIYYLGIQSASVLCALLINSEVVLLPMASELFFRHSVPFPDVMDYVQTIPYRLVRLQAFVPTNQRYT